MRYALTPPKRERPAILSRLRSRTVWIRLAWIVLLLVAIDLSPAGVLIAALVAAVIVYRNPRGWGDRMRRWTGWRNLPGLARRDKPEGFVAVLLVYALVFPGSLTGGWLLLTLNPSPGSPAGRLAATLGLHPGGGPLGLIGGPLWRPGDPALPAYPGGGGGTDDGSGTGTALAPKPGYTLYRNDGGPGHPTDSNPMPDPGVPAGGTTGQSSPSPDAGPSASPSAGVKPRPSPSPAGPPPLTVAANIQNCAPKTGTEKIDISTRPNSQVQIDVRFPDGRTGSHSTASGANGNITDSWDISLTDQSGQAQVSIRVTSGSQSASLSGSFKIYTPNVESC